MCGGGNARNMRVGGWAIAVHGGAGVDPNQPLERQEQAKQLLTRCLQLGASALRSKLPAIDVVELVVSTNNIIALFPISRHRSEADAVVANVGVPDREIFLRGCICGNSTACPVALVPSLLL